MGMEVKFPACCLKQSTDIICTVTRVHIMYSWLDITTDMHTHTHTHAHTYRHSFYGDILCVIDIGDCCAQLLRSAV